MPIQGASPLRPLPQPQPAAQPPRETWGIGRTVLDLTLPTGAGIVAQQLQKTLAPRGPIPAAIAGIVGAALFTGAAEGAIQAIGNAVRGDDLTAGISGRVVHGLKIGAITGGVTLVSPRIERAIGARAGNLHPVARVALANSAGGALGGALRTAANDETWQYGIKRGLTRIGTMAAMNAGTALAGGAIVKGVTHFRLFPKVSWMPYPFNA